MIHEKNIQHYLISIQQIITITNNFINKNLRFTLNLDQINLIN